MKMNKEKFLKTEFGAELENCIRCWDKWITIGDDEAARWCQAQWEVYKMVLRQFYGLICYFNRTDDYVGICSTDEQDWLVKIERTL